MTAGIQIIRWTKGAGWNRRLGHRGEADDDEADDEDDEDRGAVAGLAKA